MHVQHIKSLDLPELEPYRTLRRPMDHHRQGLFVAEGEKVVRRLLESDLTVRSVLMTPEWFKVYEPLLQTRSVDVFLAPKSRVETIVGFTLHQGIMGLGQVPPERSLSDILATSPRPHLLVAIDGLTNSENIGVVVRNCAAFGVHALIVGETSSSPYLRRAVRNSMGAIFKLPVLHATSLAESLSDLRSTFGSRILAAHPTGSQHLTNDDLRSDCCLVLGSEGDGISGDILKLCDATLFVKMENGVDSLNVGSASAVFLFELSRQRGRDAEVRKRGVKRPPLLDNRRKRSGFDL